MKLVRWWYGFRCFGFCLYLWPWLNRNPVWAFSRSGGDVVMAFGNRQLDKEKAMRTDDADPFNAGWNAALNEALKQIKELPKEAVAQDRVTILISKPDVLNILRKCQ